LKLLIDGTDLASAVLEVPESKISDIYPDHGKINDMIVITGKNLSIYNSLVNFLELYSVSETEYVGKVKAVDAAQNDIDVIVNTCGESIVVEDGFRFDPPEILDFYPKTITQWDEVITVTGTNFSPYPGENHVIINGVEFHVPTVPEHSYEVLEVPAIYFIGDIYQSKNESTPIIIRTGTNQEATSSENLVIDYVSTLTPSATFPAPGRTESVSFSINGKGYVGLGQRLSLEYYSDLWEFDPATEKWFKKANFPGGSRSNFVYAVADDKAYAGIGGHINDWWEYNPATNVWTKKANYPGPSTYSKVVFTINDKIYVGGGDGGYGVHYLDFWEYDPATDQWARRKNLPGIVEGYEPIAFSFHNKGYIYGYDDRYVYDPVLDTWTASSLPVLLGTAGWEVFVFDNFVVAYSFQSTLEQYFLKILPESNTHEDLNFNGAWNYSPAGFIIGNKGYIGLGQYFENSSYPQDFSSFDSADF
jgi:hypothetical protein